MEIVAPDILSSMKHPAFTLMELLIVIGILGILAATVLTAINPTKQMNDARNAHRTSSIIQIENAAWQYIIDGNTISNLPTSKATAKDVCRTEITGSACTDAPVSGIDLAALSPIYIVSMPIDEKEADTNITGFRLYVNGTIVKACAKLMGEDCGS